jgi:ankyrin repeat protein
LKNPKISYFVSFVCFVLSFFVSSAAAQTDTRLVDAARQKDVATAKALIDQGVDVTVADGDGSTALHWAASYGDLDLTQRLLKAGANVKAATRIGAATPLLMAARNGNDAVIRALLQAGGNAKDANGNGTTALMFAAASGNAASVSLLLDSGANVNATDVTNGQTALMFAASRTPPTRLGRC